MKRSLEHVHLAPHGILTAAATKMNQTTTTRQSGKHQCTARRSNVIRTMTSELESQGVQITARSNRNRHHGQQAKGSHGRLTGLEAQLATLAS